MTAASWLAGVTKGAADSTLVAKYNDLESVKALFEANKDEIAGVILEPVVGNSGFIVPDKEFLVGLRELTKKCAPPPTAPPTAPPSSVAAPPQHRAAAPACSTCGRRTAAGALTSVPTRRMELAMVSPAPRCVRAAGRAPCWSSTR